MTLCYLCNKEVRQEDEKGYEVQVNRWTMDFAKVVEYFHFHEECWQYHRLNTRNNEYTMEHIFGEFIEPSK